MSMIADEQKVGSSELTQGAVIDLWDCAAFVAVRRKQLGIALCVGVCVGVVIALLLPVRYTGRTSLLPPQQQQSAASLMMGQLSMLTGASSRDLGLKNPSDLYVGLLRSEAIANRLIERFHLQQVYGKPTMSGARKELAKHSRITVSKEGLIVIEVEDGEAKRAADLANGYTEELSLLNQGLALTEAGQRRLFFEEQLTSAKTRLEKAENDLAATERATGIVHIEGQARALAEEAAELRAQIAAKEVELRAINTYATKQNPDSRILVEQIAALRDQLQRVERSGGTGRVGSTTELTKGALDYLRSKREVQYEETLFELLGKQYEAAKLDEARDATVVQVVDRAGVPDTRSFPNRWLTVLLVVLLSVGGTFSYLLISENVQRSLSDPVRGEKLRMLRDSAGF